MLAASIELLLLSWVLDHHTEVYIPVVLAAEATCPRPAIRLLSTSTFVLYLSSSVDSHTVLCSWGRAGYDYVFLPPKLLQPSLLRLHFIVLGWKLLVKGDSLRAAHQLSSVNWAIGILNLLPTCFMYLSTT